MASHRADGSPFRRPLRPAAGGHPPRRRAAAAPTSSLWLTVPRAAVIALLGATTILAPVAGGVLGASARSAEARSQQPPEAPVASPSPEDFSLLSVHEEPGAPESVESDGGQVPTAEELAATREAAGRASRELERRTLEAQWVEEVLPGCDPTAIDLGAANGRLDTAHMCELWGTGHLLRADAAVALARLSLAYRNHFGEPPVITDSYRSYGAQVRLANRKPGLAARPGTSEHGWGLAVDFGGGVQAADEHYQWLLENAPAYGWDNPAWARKGGSSRYEPWHFEYVAGQ